MLKTEPSTSYFERLDPRVRLVWMFLMSAVVISLTELFPVLIFALALLPIWSIAARIRFMSISSIRMVPYLFFLGIIQIVVVWIGDGELLTSFAINKALLEVSRFYVMLSSAVLLFQTTSYAELTAAIRSFKTRRFPTFWNKGVEIFAFIIGVGYQMVPLLQREMQIIVQAQRAQGIGITEGSRLEQVRKLVRVGTPLFIRSLELVKNVGLAVINYSYSPLQPRSQYRELKFQLRDWIALAVLLGGAAFFLVVF